MNKSLPTPSDGNQNRTGEILGVSIGFLVISFIVVVLRLYTRLFLIKSARWDDWTILLALVMRSVFDLGVMLANLDEAWQHCRCRPCLS